MYIGDKIPLRTCFLQTATREYCDCIKICFLLQFQGFTHTLIPFCTITLVPNSISHRPTYVNIPDSFTSGHQFTRTEWLHPTSQIFYILFGGNFCEQQLVLVKLSNKVKWPTYLLCNFHMRVHNPWLVIVL